MHTAIRQRGFTLIELILFIVIVGIAVSAIGVQFNQNVQHSAEPLLRQKALTLAHSHMDAIQGLPFASVTAYTDNSVPGISVTVTVSNTAAWSATTPVESIPAADTKKITVTVTTSATAESLNFTLYRVNY
jgi:prepilin-type N-terminal cleavage/methylation domain-containing protein